ncbi:uncharacterized protein LOC142170289 [Nicotiana tabacum]|uniref:Uncharacterized protein LOC142170289 n=1 Tax=Nicotiana tabacum TaxID=4097 RepID=A0AC58STG5_TOBAC
MELVSAMSNTKEAQFPRSMKNDPSQRDPNLWSEYHRTNNYQTGDYLHLREEVVTLMKKGHLREILSGWAKNNYGRNRGQHRALEDRRRPFLINDDFHRNEINGITFSAAKKTKVLVTHSKRLREVAEDDIIFREEDTDELLLSHNDALVISLNALDFKIKRILVDLGSSTNIIQ